MTAWASSFIERSFLRAAGASRWAHDVRPLLRTSPLVLFAALTAAACGSSVVSGGGGGTGAGSGTSGTGASGVGGAPLDLCSGPGQCELLTNGCCGPCGMETLSSLSAINEANAAAFQKLTCPEPQPCPACAEQPNPNLFAYCGTNNHCVGADVRTDPVSACTSDLDCTLRYGMDCCEGCGGDPSQVVAVSVNAGLHALLCAPNTDCPGCAPQYPPNAIALCNAGHCEVVFPTPPGG